MVYTSEPVPAPVSTPNNTCVNYLQQVQCVLNLSCAYASLYISAEFLHKVTAKNCENGKDVLPSAVWLYLNHLLFRITGITSQQTAVNSSTERRHDAKQR